MYISPITLYEGKPFSDIDANGGAFICRFKRRFDDPENPKRLLGSDGKLRFALDSVDILIVNDRQVIHDIGRKIEFHRFDGAYIFANNPVFLFFALQY